MVKCVLFTFNVKLKYAEGPTDGTYSHHIFIRVECRFGIYNKSFEMATKRQLNVTTSALWFTALTILIIVSCLQRIVFSCVIMTSCLQTCNSSLIPTAIVFISMHFISIIGFTSLLFTSNSYFTITLANIFFIQRWCTLAHLRQLNKCGKKFNILSFLLYHDDLPNLLHIQYNQMILLSALCSLSEKLKNIICIEIDDIFMVTVITLLRGKSNSLGSN